MRGIRHRARLAALPLLAGLLVAGCSSSGSGDGGFSLVGLLGSAAIVDTAPGFAPAAEGGAGTAEATGPGESEAVMTADIAPVEVDAAARQPSAAVEPSPAAEPAPAAKTQRARRRGFLTAFWGGGQDAQEDAPAPDLAPAPARIEAPARMQEDVAAAPEPPRRLARSYREDALPGVRSADDLFEISRKSGLDDIRDIDLNEDDGTYMVASAGGLARLAPNGLLRQREDVDVSCLKPSLVRMLRTVEQRYGKRVIVTSGYRSPAHNKRVRGAPRSFHMACAAADIQVPGIS